jgi:hypothetical protein
MHPSAAKAQGISRAMKELRTRCCVVGRGPARVMGMGLRPDPVRTPKRGG